MFSFNFEKIREFFMKLIRPSLYMGGVDYFLKAWHEADAKERGILIGVFAPTFLSLAGLLFSIVYFVLFILPSILFRLLGWGLLAALFGAGGKYCFEYFTGKQIPQGTQAPQNKDSEVIDVQYTENKS